MYKLINGHPKKFTGQYICYNGMIYANPTDKQLLSAGYKPLVETERPDDAGTTYWVDVYTETDTEIVQSWVQHEIEEVE